MQPSEVPERNLGGGRLPPSPLSFLSGKFYWLSIIANAGAVALADFLLSLFTESAGVILLINGVYGVALFAAAFFFVGADVDMKRIRTSLLVSAILVWLIGYAAGRAVS